MCVNLILTPVAMDVAVVPASLQQKVEWLIKGVDRWREAGRGGGEISLNKDRNGLFLKTCPTESMCFPASVPL